SLRLLGMTSATSLSETCWRPEEAGGRRWRRVSEREEMLERVRRALGRSKGSVPSAPSYASEEWPPAGQPIMPRIAAEELVATFEAELRKVGGVPYRASAPQELDEVIRAILRSCGATAAVLSRNPLLSRLRLA